MRPVRFRRVTSGCHVLYLNVPTRILGIIPARFASSRFPGKALALIAGKTMLQHVWERALQARYLTNVIVATDDERILRRSAPIRGPVRHDAGGSCLGDRPRRRGRFG